MTSLRKTSFLLALLVLEAMPAWAEDTASAPITKQEKMINMFQTFDRNGDGFIADFEYIPVTRSAFSFLDKNSDGKITKEENAMDYIKLNRSRSTDDAKLTAEANKYFLEDDKNKDGVITQYEHMRNAKDFFMKFDKNKDGFTSQDEFLSTLEKGNIQKPHWL